MVKVQMTGDLRQLAADQHKVQAVPRLGLRRYSVAGFCVLIAFAVRYWLSPVLGEELPFMLFIAAALFAAWYAGVAIGLVSLMVGIVLGQFFFLVPQAKAVEWPYVEAFRFVRYLFTGLLGIGLIGTLHREVARRKQSETELFEAKEQLEHRVVKRTAELASTVESLEGLLYQMAHSLRAPLRAINGYAVFLKDEGGTKLSAEEREYLHKISNAAERMDSLIKDLLEYGRLGHVEIPLCQVNLEEAIEGTLSKLAKEIRTKKGEIKLERPFPEVQANADVLQEVLLELLENAIKFVAQDRQPRVRIWSEERGSWVRLWIQDNGVGVDTRYHQRVFGIFEQLYPQGWESGSGIGLAIVKQGMQRMGGQVGIDSGMDTGSRFWVDLQKARKD